MQIWAKRGIQTALITGGMLMLGTGIASADESFNPDQPPSALDGSVKVPLKIDNNALGTPFGQHNLGGVNHDVTVTPSDLAGAAGGAAPALPTTGGLPGLPTAGGMPPALTSTDGLAPALPTTGGLPSTDKLTEALPTAGGLPTTDSLGQALPVTGGLPSTANLTQALPTAGGLPGTTGLPGTDALPATGGLPVTGKLPATDGLPVTGGLPATEGLPLTGGLPATEGLPLTDGLPATEGLPLTDGLPATDKLTGALPTGGMTPALPTTDALAPANGALAAGPLTVLAPNDGVSPKSLSTEGDIFRGNKIVGDVVIPIDISGNAIAILGDASVENSSDQTAGQERPIVTDGSHSGLAGNVVSLMWAAPIQITGNAVAVGGTADSYNTASQTANADGDIETDGHGGALSGNVLAGQAATPVQLNGNAVSGAGIATSDSATSSDATAGGTILTNGEDGALSGNVGALPVAVPVQGNGNAVSLIGIADTLNTSSAYAQAGEETPGIFGSENYITTDGAPSAGSGNIVQPALSGPVAVNCNSLAGIGISETVCDSSGDAAAGGGNITSGEEGTLAGSIAHAPVAIPTQGSGNAGAVIGNATTDSVNAVSSTAGGDSYTIGDDSVLSGLVAEPSVAAPIDACGNTGAGGGQAGAVCVNDSFTEAGGDAGTTGNDSVGSGNAGTVPVALPIEGLGNTVGAAGTSETTTTENKITSSGGDNNTMDDAGTLASNLVTVPVAGPVQLTGNGGGVVADTDAHTHTNSDIDAGGYSKAKGDGGSLAGNIVQAPVAFPVQGFNDGATVVGHGTQTGTNDVDSTSGGWAQTNGQDGSGTGNVVTAPVAGAAQLFGSGAAVLGSNDAAAESTTDSTAGGTVVTSGENGNIAGNVIAAQLLPIAQGFGLAGSAIGGMDTAAAANETNAVSGGDITTNGDFGQLSGNLLDVPAAAVVQPHGDAVAVLFSDSLAASDNLTNGTAGGTSTTSGELGSLSGFDGDLPIGINLPIYDVPVEILAEAMTFATNESNITVGEDSPQLDLPQSGALEATTLPSMPRLGALPMAGNARTGAVDPFSALLGGLLGGASGFDMAGGLLGHGGVDSLSGVTGGLGGVPSIQEPLDGNPLAGVSGVTGKLNGKKVNLPAPTAPKPAPRFAAPVMPGLDNLRGVFKGDLFQAPKLDKLPVQTPALAGLKTPVALPTAPAPRTGVPALPSLDDTKAKLAGVFGHFPIG